MAYDTDSLVCEIEFRQVDLYQEGATPQIEPGFIIDDMVRSPPVSRLLGNPDASDITTAFTVDMTPGTNPVLKTQNSNTQQLCEERSSPEIYVHIYPPELDNQYDDQTECGPTIVSTPDTITLNGNEQDAEEASSTSDCHVQIECHENSSSDKECICCAAQCLCQ